MLTHFGCYLQAQASFADATRTNKREQTDILTVQEFLYVRHGLLTSNKRRGLDR